MRGQLSENYTDPKAIYYSDQVIRGLLTSMSQEQIKYQNQEGAAGTLEQLVIMLENATAATQAAKAKADKATDLKYPMIERSKAKAANDKMVSLN